MPLRNLSSNSAGGSAGGRQLIVSRIQKVSRRSLLIGAAGLTAVAGSGGLWLAVRRQRNQRWAKAVRRAQPFAPSVYLAVGRDSVVTIWLTRSEMGQGVMTALPMIVAEELDADFDAIRVEQAVADGTQDYGKLLTAASASVRSNWIELRRAGAAARQMLLAAAARSWGVDPETCQTQRGWVIHSGSSRKASYGSLAVLARAESVPLRPQLKDPQDFRLVGTHVPRIDIPAKVTGRASFGMDVRLPGMRYAAVARCPTFGGKLRSVDDAKARKVPGVLEVFAIDDAVAVVAENTWAAFRGRDALELGWIPGAIAAVNNRSINETLDELSRKPGVVARILGDSEQAFESAARRLEASYRFPFLAHAPMEPLNCTVRIGEGRCEVWVPTQHPEGARDLAAKFADLPLDRVAVRTTLIGGGFGRRSDPDEVREAVQIARRIGGAVQLVWSREDDLRHGRYREAALHRVSAALSRDGIPIGWHHHVVSPSIEEKSSTRGEVDGIVTAGSADNPYAIRNIRVEWSTADLGVPVGIWRSVGHSHGAFALECFMDEIARSGRIDPVDLRRRLLTHKPRLLACLNQAVGRSRWPARRTSGRALGCAVAECFGSFSAQVAEVSVDSEGRPHVHRVWCAVDVGLVIHPDTIKAQIEGGIAFGLTAALRGRISIDQGGVREGNFHDYPLLRQTEMPEIDLAILPSREPPGGVGELAVPGIAPAVANGIHALTGKPPRGLPLAQV